MMVEMSAHSWFMQLARDMNLQFLFKEFTQTHTDSTHLIISNNYTNTHENFIYLINRVYGHLNSLNLH